LALSIVSEDSTSSVIVLPVSLDEYLHPTTQVKDEVKGEFLLDVVVRKSTTVFKLLFGEYQMLLVERDPFLILNKFVLTNICIPPRR
jgi:hypothetical protein